MSNENSLDKQIARLENETADTEGHMPRIKLPESDISDTDTEGNMPRVKVPQSDTEDTEANGVRVRFVQPAGEDGDDTEGNGVRVRI